MERGKHFKTDFKARPSKICTKKEVKLLSNGTIWKTFILH